MTFEELVSKLYLYDLETYPNCFLFAGKFYGQNQVYRFEISDRVNQRDALMQHLSYLQSFGAIMVGFNNLNFDYPILHELLVNQFNFSAMHAYLQATKIIETQQKGFSAIGFKDRKIPQIDLYKINHFD